MKTITCSVMTLLLMMCSMIVLAETSTAPPQGAPPQAIQSYKQHPGYVDFKIQDIGSGIKPNVQILLEEPLLKMISSASANSEPEFAQVLSLLKLVRVEVTENLAGKAPEIRSRFAEQTSLLKEKQGWNSMVHVEENDESVDIMLKFANNKIAGLALFVQGADEVVFINIVGEVEVERLGRVLGKMGGKFMQGNMDLSQFEKMLSGFTPKTEPAFIVKGTVCDAVTMKPIARAKVGDHEYGPEPRKSTFTKADGSFEYTTWPEEHAIIIEAPGYKLQYHNLKATLLQGMKEYNMQILLSPATAPEKVQ